MWHREFCLFLTALIWGVAFVAQSVGMDYVGAFTFNCVRCLIGGIFLKKHVGARIWFSVRELSGCVLMFGAIILSQLPERRKRQM